MTTAQKIIKNKVGLLMLAETKDLDQRIDSYIKASIVWENSDADFP
ncbi:hypothetical protein ACO2J1_14940 [Leptospira interrogans]|nr:hypothetical protein [Leptospira interrogans]EKO70249.1 hypothetical protein LEP1GSC069_1495 [Leptospira interrogans serovar Canicola str. Fiocruz LV133]EMK23202.1 hypothetical protein LEP1GSC075_1282 [Leptospira interrogans str. Kito]EMN77881.1 hypothetical protein LEP1GSC102_1382 [Leptospira interrogans str. UI 09600]